MKVNTVIGKTKHDSFLVKVHTMKIGSSYWTSLSMRNDYNHLTLVSRYTDTFKEASKFHLQLASQAKILFDLD